MSILLAATLVNISAVVSPPAALECIPPDVYDMDTVAMDVALGITDAYLRETFEDAALACDVIAEVPTGSGWYEIYGTPNADEIWDGTSLLNNHPFTDGNVEEIRLAFPGGAVRVGMGISHLEQDTPLYVNGVLCTDNLKDIDGFSIPGSGNPGRNGFLWIEFPDGTHIEEIVIDSQGSDTIYVDHLVWIEPCHGDLNDDGQIGFADLVELLSTWGPTMMPGDLDCSGETDFADLLRLLERWGPCN